MTARDLRVAKSGRIILIILLILLALVICAAVSLETRWGRDIAEDLISQRMGGRDVNIGDLNIDWGFPLGIKATDVSIANPIWARHEQMISLAQLDATLKVAPLFQGKLSFVKINLHRPQVHLARREDGSFQGKKFELNAEGGAPSAILKAGRRYPINIDAPEDRDGYWGKYRARLPAGAAGIPGTVGVIGSVNVRKPARWPVF